MSQISITVSPIPGQIGKPVGWVGTERECGTFLDITAHNVITAGIQVRMEINADQIPHARLSAYLRFALAMKRLDSRMLPDFDYRILLEHTSPTGKQI